jgi:molybdopterin/thiamine biosynthesis adenylyltransferase
MFHSAPVHRIALVGVGALGCRLLQRLAPHRGLVLSAIDGDRVDAGNIERQPLFEAAHVGSPKVEAAHQALRHTGNGITAIDAFVDARNVFELLPGCHAVLDCTDDLHAKDVLDKACAQRGIPLVSGGAHGRQGMVLCLHATGQPQGLTRRSIFQGPIGAEQDGCDMSQVPASVLDAMAQRMSESVLALLSGAPARALAVFDARHGAWVDFAIGHA